MNIDLTYILDRSSSGAKMYYTLNSEMNTTLKYFSGKSAGAFVPGAGRYAAAGQDKQESTLTFITFNHECTEEDVILNSLPIRNIDRNSFRFFFDGATNPAAGINRALDMAELRRIKRKHSNEPIMPAVFILFSDGYPDAGSRNGKSYDLNRQKKVIMKSYAETAERIKTLEQTGEVLFFAVPVAEPGKKPNIDLLRELTAYSDRVLTGTSYHKAHIIDKAINENMASHDYTCHPLDKFR